MPVSSQLPGLLPNNFPAVPMSRGSFPDGNVRNQDGTQNDAEHPAAAGSTITVFVTGMGVAQPSLTPGSIATSKTLATVIPIYSPWAYSGETLHKTPPPPALAYSVPGFVSLLFQSQFRCRIHFSLLAAPMWATECSARVSIWPHTYAPFDGPGQPASSVIGVYLK